MGFPAPPGLDRISRTGPSGESLRLYRQHRQSTFAGLSNSSEESEIPRYARRTTCAQAVDRARVVRPATAPLGEGVILGARSTGNSPVEREALRQSPLVIDGQIIARHPFRPGHGV